MLLFNVFIINTKKDFLAFIIGGIITGMKSKKKENNEEKKEIIVDEFINACIVCFLHFCGSLNINFCIYLL